MIQIHSITGGVASTNAYLIADDASKQAVIFDAPDHSIHPLLDVAKRNGYDLIGLWLTHGHFDHMADHAEVKAAFPKAKILIHPLDGPKLRSPGVQTRMFMLPFTIPPCEPDELIEDGQVLKLGEMEVKVIHTPGHAPGHVMYWFESEKILIGGDLIICGAVGRTDFPDCSEPALRESIKKVYQMCPNETQLLPGHCEVTTLGDERVGNDYVRAVLRANG